ncbi:Wall-associated receptor kinase, galacturonan-binding domain [Dillenia turbinata]|uniref:RING-type E3 ubiquitin transferase n=1 Tax=Dillenia turbinata TaxID=194707 RepID=A0AAN8ZN75_9MAGN
MSLSLFKPHFLSLFLPFFFCYFFASKFVASLETCPTSSCSGNLSNIPIKFPFKAKDNPKRLCGYPGFDLRCSTRVNQTVLKPPHDLDFTVVDIDYEGQTIRVNDPDHCLPKRILNLNLTGSPFTGINGIIFTFINCTANTTLFPPPTQRIKCLSNQNYSVFATNSAWVTVFADGDCQAMTLSVPIDREEYSGGFSDLNEDLVFTWTEPDCQACYSRGGLCGLKSSSGLDVGCTKNSQQGFPRSAKYGLIIGAGIPALVCIIGLACYICGWIRSCGQRTQPTNEFSSSIPLRPNCCQKGLDQPTIESYPKIILGESRRLPKPNDDGVCSICLSDYLPKETLRTIPECNHYFHANCIDEWLKTNGTCPLCRNTPDGSSPLTPSVLSSSSRSSSAISSPSRVAPP